MKTNAYMTKNMLAAVALGLVLSVPGLANAKFNFTTIDVPHSTGTAVNANSENAIAGNYTDTNGNTHGFVLRKGVFQYPIDAPKSPRWLFYPSTYPSVYTQINGINAKGEITGTTIYANESCPTCVAAHAFFMSKEGDFTILDPYFDPKSNPHSIRSQSGFVNSYGVVVGTYRTSDQMRHGFIWSKGNFTDKPINCPGDDAPAGTVVFGINDHRQIVGDCVIGGNRHGFLLSKGVYTTFDPPGSGFTVAEGINNAGQIVGWYTDAPPPNNKYEYGFVKSNGVFEKINVPGSTYTDVYSINAQGEIVGAYGDAKGVDHGFIGTSAHAENHRNGAHDDAKDTHHDFDGTHAHWLKSMETER
jgi:uncharacterized membrane protein